ncbi:sigma-70 family RNA polymerase sigma factor [Sphingobacterium sp.]|uniref:RNA polymerase sigma factor n=1 Tax=Sphingobacterium sp. TaxID=341027 RepID=UPI0031DDD56A
MKEQDQNLIQSVNNSDPKAFKTIFEQYWQLIYRLALQKLPSDDDANDITREVFYLIWKNRENWHVKTNIQAYLKAMLKHKIYDFYALRDRLPVMIPLDSVEDYWEKMFEKAEDEQQDFSEQNKMVRDEIDKMPEKMREVFLLSRFEGLSAAQIADKLGISIQTVRNQISFALKRLKDRFGDKTLWLLLIFLLDQ